MTSAAVFALLLCCPLMAAGRDQKVALLIIDVQDCFLPGGGMAVQDGEAVVGIINQLRTDNRDTFSLVALSKDWHCADHVSFASQFPGRAPYSTVNLTYDAEGRLCKGGDVPPSFPHAVQCSEANHTVTQTLWPDHCVKNVTSGLISSSLDSGLLQESDDVIIYKGNKCGVDSYSAFFDNGAFSSTRLDSVLQSRDISTVFVAGLATDYCVLYTSLDAVKLGYRTFTIVDASRGVAPDTTKQALARLHSAGVTLLNSTDVRDTLLSLTSGSSMSASTGVSFIVNALMLLRNL